MGNNSIDINELKIIQLDLLEKYHNYCEKNGYTYYLAYGSLLGAVRHEGYIPWDDDIDVIMPRRDYESLLGNFNNTNNDPDISLIFQSKDKDYYLPFAKLVNNKTVMKEEVNSGYTIGVYIDIFPLDNLSNEYEIAKHLVKKAFKLNALLTLKNLKLRSNRPFYKNAIIVGGRCLSCFFDRKLLIKIINNLCSGNSATKFVGVLTGISSGNESRIFQKEWFESRVLKTFEKKEFYAPIGYDDYLSKIYGNYLELPPKDKQVSHHSFKAWYKEGTK